MAWNLRVVPDMFDSLAWSSPIEYIGQFPTIPLHCGEVREVELILKRIFDIIFSTLAIVFPFTTPGSTGDCHQTGFTRSGVLLVGAHWQEGTRVSLHQVSHHGSRRGSSSRRNYAHE